MSWLYKKVYGRDPPRPPITDIDRINLDPILKWRLHGFFPWKLVLDVVFLVCIVVVVFYRSENLNLSTYTSRAMFATILSVHIPTLLKYAGSPNSKQSVTRTSAASTPSANSARLLSASSMEYPPSSLH
jgi:hypothetical protein